MANQTPKNQGNQRPKNEKGPDDRFEWKKAARTLSFWTLLIILVIVLLTYFSPQNEKIETVKYTKYKELLNADAIVSAVVVGNEFTGTLRDPGDIVGGKFRTVFLRINDDQIREWEDKGIQLEFQEKSTNWLGYVLSSILPWIIIIAFWLFIMRRMQGGGTRGIFSFGKSRAKLLIDNKPNVTFEDIAGAEEAKEEVQEIIHFLRDPKKFQRLGGRIPRGAILIGPPGTGKTLLGRAIAGEAQVPFFSMSGADFVEMFVGVGASRVRDLFEQGKKHAPCIIFIDEIDAVGRQRGAGMGGGHDEREQTLNQLLVEMDGFDTNEGVILVAATNRPDVLDPALLRPGRFDRQIVVDRPDVRGRIGIFKVHTRKVPLNENVDIEVMAKGTPGLSGADIANLVNEAALLAARNDADNVSMRDFEDAKDKVMMGTERRSMVITDEEKKLTAYHEAGHALVAQYTPKADPVHKVTIIPRGRALGVTHFLPIDEKHSWSKDYIEEKLVHLLGGRAAERVVFDDYTNGAANDIKQATAIARKMVCDWGMSDKIGPLALGGQDGEVFLGRDFATKRDFSEATAIEIDREVKRFVLKAQSTAEATLRDHLDQLHLIALALLEREILDGDEIQTIISGKKLSPAVRNRSPRYKRKPPRRDSKTVDTKSVPDDKDKGEVSSRLKKVDDVLAKIDAEDSKVSKSDSTPKQADSKKDSSTSSTGSTKSRPRNRPYRKRVANSDKSKKDNKHE
ncbi:MAG: ATP-dependent zinc metalloprotease FtsH [Candidatus Electryonea clarkiae]|nr:ATP-dependent zinc metalloprotease FtsH [Candidatus Electryonea clarkiae]MDP8285921.1 ATP-dependent zinc metalloprotease FtsH [Candidatus Electryonea clarkiae]